MVSAASPGSHSRSGHPIVPALANLTRTCPPAILPLLFLAGVLVLFWHHSRAINQQWDFGVYYLAASTWSQGENPYSESALHEQALATLDTAYHGLPFLYPPWVLPVLYPLSLLPLFEASFLWLLCKCALLEVQLACISRLVWGRMTLLTWVLLHGVALFYHPVSLDMASGNTTLIESTLALLALVAYQTNRWWLSAVLLAMAGGIKWMPLALLAIPWMEREVRFLWRFGVVASVGLASILLQAETWRWYLGYMQSPQWDLHWDEQVQSVYNSSSLSLLLRTTHDTYFFDALIDAPWAVPIGITLLGVILLLVVRQVFQPPALSLATRATCILLATLLIWPRLAGYSLVWTLLPLMTILHKSMLNRSISAFCILAIGVMCIQTYIAPSSIESGLEQLLIDKDMLGVALLMISLVVSVRAESGNRSLRRDDLPPA